MSAPLNIRRSAAASIARSLFLILLLSCQGISGILGKSQLCEVETGQTNIILDIEESRGDFIGQQTTPPELPIYGDPYTEIASIGLPKGT
nr:cadherin-99C-like [Bactrocera oleae]